MSDTQPENGKRFDQTAPELEPQALPPEFQAEITTTVKSR